MDPNKTVDHVLPTFACDAMLGSLARWLRAAGYDTYCQVDIDDWDLVRRCQRAGRILLSSDTGIFRIGIVRDGDVPALFIPHGLDKFGQLAFVLRKFNLPLRAALCMACGGELLEVAKEQVRERVPPRSFSWQEHFYQCRRCGRLFWEGTHWKRIERHLQEVSAQCIEALPGDNLPAS